MWICRGLVHREGECEDLIFLEEEHSSSLLLLLWIGVGGGDKGNAHR